MSLLQIPPTPNDIGRRVIYNMRLPGEREGHLFRILDSEDVEVKWDRTMRLERVPIRKLHWAKIKPNELEMLR
jgi:hypothetical protein